MSTPPPVRPLPPSDRHDPRGAPWPGLIPLRPLGLGDIFAAAIRLFRAHFTFLAAVAAAGSLLSAGAVIGVLAWLPAGSDDISQAWYTQVSEGKLSAAPTAVLLPLLVGGALSLVTTFVVAGLSAAFATADALGSTVGRSAFDRLRGRWPGLVAVAALMTVAVLIGFALFVLPGLFAMAMLLLAAPALVVEGGKPLAALARAAKLSFGARGRILGVTVVAYLITTAIGSVVMSFLPTTGSVPNALAGLVLQVAVSAMTVPFVASVMALLYVDTRIRKEDLAAALIRASGRG